VTALGIAAQVFSLDFAPEYQDWDAIEPGGLFTAPVVSVARSEGIVKHIEDEARGAHVLILWLDCDRVRRVPWPACTSACVRR
jgi:DNA topoisomerase-3